MFRFTRRALMITATCVSIAGCVTDERALNKEDLENSVFRLESVALGNRSVGLRWDLSSEYTTSLEGNEEYSLHWEPVSRVITSPNDSGSIYLTPTTYQYKMEWVVTGLEAELYEFSVRTVYGPGAVSPDVAICRAAPSIYLVTDATRPGEEIRLYERASALGSG